MALHLCATGWHVARRDISAACSSSCMHNDHGVHVLFGLRCGSLPRTKRQFTELEVISGDQKYGDLHKDVQTFVNFILPACFTALKYFVMIGLYVAMICFIYGASPLCHRLARGQARHFRRMQQ